MVYSRFFSRYRAALPPEAAQTHHQNLDQHQPPHHGLDRKRLEAAIFANGSREKPPLPNHC